MKTVLMLCAALLLLGCTGKRGPTGPVGPVGPDGPGTRIVYISTLPIPTDNVYTVAIPEITLSDMPLITTYVCPSGYSLWYELPAYFENYPGFGQICFYTEGHVSFQYCRDFYYKVVIVE